MNSATRKVNVGVYSIDGHVTGDHYMILNRGNGWSIHIDDIGTVSHARTLTLASDWCRQREAEHVTESDKVYLETVPISALKVGDVVHTNGMRVLLDRDPFVFNTLTHSPALSFDGLVLNRDDLTDPFLLAHVDEDDPRWTVQSNDLVRWTRETTDPFAGFPGN